MRVEGFSVEGSRCRVSPQVKGGLAFGVEVSVQFCCLDA